MLDSSQVRRRWKSQIVRVLGAVPGMLLSRKTHRGGTDLVGELSWISCFVASSSETKTGGDLVNTEMAI